jgi:signal peptidase I
MRAAAPWALVICTIGCGPAAVILDPIAQWLDSRFESFYAPSEGMLPTLRVDEHFYVNAAAYSERDPQRGEVVVFELAREGTELFQIEDRPELKRERFIKRIVALPGDTIELTEGRLSINGDPILEEPTPETVTSLSGYEIELSIQELDTGPFRIGHGPTPDPTVIPPTLVERDRYFLLGDNRSNSRDSRHFGTVHRNSLIGPVTGVYLSGWLPTWRRINP